MKVAEPLLQRDMDLIRLLLLRSAGYDVAEEIEAYSSEQRAFHVALLKDAGYVDAVIRTNEEGFPNGSVVIRLTWQGYEFLELVKDGKLWGGAKKVFTKAVGWTTPLLLEWLKNEARAHIPGLQTLTNHNP